MATKAAHKRLLREHQNLSTSPPPYISAHPSEHNILEWHYILTGPPDTPYTGGQYWGTLVFPPDYPFAPPAIRMHTESGRFRCNERLCLSISDFHPKSFNPAWEVSTILLGVQSFMTSEEMTTGSVSAPDFKRKQLAGRTRWYNSTGGGTTTRKLGESASQHAAKPVQQQSSNKWSMTGRDGGAKFREEWPEEDEENWKWMEENQIDPKTGDSLKAAAVQDAQEQQSGVTESAQKAAPASGAGQKQAHTAQVADQGWLGKNWGKVAIAAVFIYVLAARMMSDVNA
ncbi:ubiquitin-protein ligase [Hortaea werneckii]|nr:ubiquitin-protein ligase [Hortaea werneckii]